MEVSDTGSLRRRASNRITWQDVLDAVGTLESELRRMHTTAKLDRGGDLYGTIAVRFTVDRDRVELHHVDSDPHMKPLEAGVVRMIVGAPFRESPTPMQVELECTFADDAGGGWNPGGGNPFGGGFGGGGRGDDRAFGDPF